MLFIQMNRIFSKSWRFQCSVAHSRYSCNSVDLVDFSQTNHSIDVSQYILPVNNIKIS